MVSGSKEYHGSPKECRAVSADAKSDVANENNNEPIRIGIGRVRRIGGCYWTTAWANTCSPICQPTDRLCQGCPNSHSL